MTIRRFTRLALGLLAALLLLPCAARAQKRAAALPAVVWTAREGGVSVVSDELEGGAWLFLPSSADLSALPLVVDAQPDGLCWLAADGSLVPFRNGYAVDWAALSHSPREGAFTAALVSEADRRPVLTLNVMVSASLRSAHITSDDPVNEGRAWLEDCPLHEKSTTASLVMLRPDGSVSCAEAIEKLRGRGNSTWEKAVHKKPYQLKLKYKHDLLESGDPREANKKWVLLSNEAILTDDKDLSMLRNQIALDLGLEFGLTETSRCEQVDLYYDRQYRGTYLLCEKVEVKRGRLEIDDYDELIERAAKAMGVALDALPMGEGVNRYGQPIHFTRGAPEPQDVQAAGYLIELERGTYDDGTVSDPAWFTMSNGQNFALKNPSMGGERAVAFASELMEEAYAALVNYGVHPETGAPVSQLMDVDSFTRSFLINEALMNKDAYASTSTNFVVPAGERKLYAGPIWDFDLSTEKPCELRDNSDWARAFYRDTTFQAAAKRVYADELYPLIRDVLLGGRPGRRLKSLAQYERELTASWNMNYRRFFAAGLGRENDTATLASYARRLRDTLAEHSAWLAEEIASWTEDEPSAQVDVTLSSPVGDIERFMRAAVEDEQRSSLHVTGLALTRLREATLDADALWRAEIALASKPGCALADGLRVLVNGEEAACEPLEGGAALATFVFEDPLYRPAVYEGRDYGLAFHYHTFANSYPELLEQCGGTPEGALRYYVETGMDEGLACSDWFDPSAIAMANPRLEEKYQDDWRAYTELYLDAGRTTALDPFVPEAASEP